MKKSLALLLISICITAPTIMQAQFSSWQWGKCGTGSGPDYGFNVATDKDGNVYVTGQFSSDTLMLDNHMLINDTTHTSDFFLVKYNSSGQILWARSAGGSDYDAGTAVAVDSAGNCYVTGYFKSKQIVFGAHVVLNHNQQSFYGYSDVFIVKYSPDGNVLWTKSAGSGQVADAEGEGIAIDAAGNCIVTGFFGSVKIGFDNDTLINANPVSPDDDVFVVKLDSLGHTIWATSFGGSYDDWGYDVDLDANQNIFVSGIFRSGAMRVGTDSLFNHGSYDAFIVKYDWSGNFLWAKNGGGTYTNSFGSVAIDRDGNSYITGSYSYVAVFDSDTLPNISDGDIYLVKYTPDGQLTWAKSFGGNYGDGGSALVVDAHNNLWLSGAFSSDTLVLGSSILINNTPYWFTDLFLAKFDLDGNPILAISNGGINDDYVNSVSVDGANNIYVTGWFSSPTLAFGSDSITNHGAMFGNEHNSNVLTAKLSSLTGLSALSLENGLKAFPNPASTILNMQVPTGLLGSSANILDLTGRIIQTFPIQSAIYQLPITAYQSGLYLIELRPASSEIKNEEPTRIKWVKL